MRLSDGMIEKELDAGELSIEPLDREVQIQPASVDLRLGGEHMYIGDGDTYSLEEYVPPEMMGYTEDEIVIHPDECVLATTEETLSVPNTMDATVYGRSSIGRLFIHIHTAGYIDPGFSGQVTLELVNHSSNTYKLPVGTRICQIVFTQLGQPTTEGYGDKDDAKYADQSGVTSSQINEDFDD